MACHMATVAEIFRRYGPTYRTEADASLPHAHRRVMIAIEHCRTAALGGHAEQCDRCGHTRVWYNSCRNRHCPQCQCLARATWIDQRETEVLDTEYFHMVFTVPEPIAAIALQNKAVVYDILFRAVAETLHTIAGDPKHLGAHIGFFAVLHTWGQTLVFHPHVHCVIAGGGLSPDGTRWVACRRGFFLPVRVLSRLFRRLFLRYLADAWRAGRLRFVGALAPLAERRSLTDHVAATRRTEWVVYAKRPFAGPRQVLEYVGRYTHRVAISNERLIAIDDGHVRFRYKDYRADASPEKIMTLTAPEFIRRFLLHVLPRGFHRIRYYGWLGARVRRERLAHCRQLLAMPRLIHTSPETRRQADYRDRYAALTGFSLRACPVCGDGYMEVVELVVASRAAMMDTS